MKDDCILCFCEDITRAEIQQAIKKGAETPDELKRLLRPGMGACQGKTCEGMIIQEIMAITGKTRDEIPIPPRRPPAEGIYLQDLARSDWDEN